MSLGTYAVSGVVAGGVTPSPGPVAFGQALFTGNSKTSGTTLVLTGSKTVTAGRTIFVAYACDPGTQSAIGVTDNLGNTYTEVKAQTNGSGTSGVRTRLFKAFVTVGGTLTTQTISWTGAVTAKAAASAEYTGIGTQANTDGYGATDDDIYGHAGSSSSPAGGAVIFAAGIQLATTFSAGLTTFPTAVRAQAATAGSTTDTNISVAIADRLTSGAESYTSDWPTVRAAAIGLNAGAIGTYNSA